MQREARILHGGEQGRHAAAQHAAGRAAAVARRRGPLIISAAAAAAHTRHGVLTASTHVWQLDQRPRAAALASNRQPRRPLVAAQPRRHHKHRAVVVAAKATAAKGVRVPAAVTGDGLPTGGGSR